MANDIKLSYFGETSGCTLQINEPQLQLSKHQCATHQELYTSTVSG
jgi:hypothetical protein